jgi:hypothetical protein
MPTYLFSDTKKIEEIRGSEKDESELVVCLISREVVVLFKLIQKVVFHQENIVEICLSVFVIKPIKNDVNKCMLHHLCGK